VPMSDGTPKHLRYLICYSGAVAGPRGRRQDRSSRT
jgi:hypothetical protein